MARLMALQQDISLEHNRRKIGKTCTVLIDRKEGDHFLGRTEYDSPEVDNEVLIDAREHYVRVGDFVKVRITDTSEFDLQAVPL
jgi:ribosomal protein S12 methylthiotransferase